MGEATILLRDTAAATAAPAEVERKLTVPELLWNDGFVRKTVIIIFLAAAWEIYGTFLDNPLLFPTFHDTILSMFDKVRDGTIALLPLALIWFGLGNGSLVFVLIHSVLWPVALNTHSGFKSVSNTLRMVGR